MQLKELNVIINGKPYRFNIEPGTTLIELIRDQLSLTGTKRGCSDGSCSTCTVIVEGKAVKSCSILALQLNGKSILTIEGLEKDGQLHPLQESFIENHGMQCGYCTPGMIMSAKALLDENPKPTDQEIREGILGNLCRCATYPRIVKSIAEAAKKIGGQQHG
jgi:aerobic-type carbon monoxide dehydrogenase small subunit (CoxS/CutS family)